MVRFLKKLGLYILIVMLCMGVLFAAHYAVVGNQYQNNYQAALNDKIQRLESIDRPKIILVGHSNLSFGIDSARIEEAFGMPVVNLGLHAGLGNAFHERVAKLNINEGDIVVICHSDYSDDGRMEDTGLFWVAFDNNLRQLSLMGVKDMKNALLSYPDYFRASFLLWAKGEGNADAGNSYSRNAFNEYGDVVFKPEREQMNADDYFSKNECPMPGIGDACVRRLNRLNKYVCDRNASLVIAGYPVAYGEYSEYTKEDFIEFRKQLENAVDCEVISDYTDYFYPYEYFYNTYLHLTEEGTAVRTGQLISDIESWLDRV